MKSSLSVIQTLSKIGKIFSKVIFIFCIIGGVGCILGIIALILGINGSINLLGIDFHSIISGNIKENAATLYAQLVNGLIFAAGEAIIAKFAEIYFSNELKAGTPFTFDGAKEFLRLGIIATAIPVISDIITGISTSIFSVILEKADKSDISISSSIGLGITFIIVSFIFKLGAENSSKSNEAQTPTLNGNAGDVNDYE